MANEGQPKYHKLTELHDLRAEEDIDLSPEFINSALLNLNTAKQAHIDHMDKKKLLAEATQAKEMGRSRSSLAGAYVLALAQGVTQQSEVYLAQLDPRRFVALYDYATGLYNIGSSVIVAENAISGDINPLSDDIPLNKFQILDPEEKNVARILARKKIEAMQQLLTEDSSGYKLIDEVAKKTTKSGESLIPDDYFTNDKNPNESEEIVGAGINDGLAIYKLVYKMLEPVFAN
ncbi:MAG TPA: hypothetical protein VG917_04705 [Patescibacteria group bacterium]|nr:hypothetical protein [Patescibacteria group bacterium]